ncbi:hypothetical protein ILYODFUR_028522 [Ilyodon furcidens]|uniref:Uncharacterized protein n=1 Tax=Ilyodon furcidens TaxID=33524 RepID=A0ABV0TYU8_9TELE
MTSLSCASVHSSSDCSSVTVSSTSDSLFSASFTIHSITFTFSHTEFTDLAEFYVQAGAKLGKNSLAYLVNQATYVLLLRHNIRLASFLVRLNSSISHSYSPLAVWRLSLEFMH